MTMKCRLFTGAAASICLLVLSVAVFAEECPDQKTESNPWCTQQDIDCAKCQFVPFTDACDVVWQVKYSGSGNVCASQPNSGNKCVYDKEVFCYSVTQCKSGAIIPFWACGGSGLGGCTLPLITAYCTTCGPTGTYIPVDNSSYKTEACPTC